jgi:hypothetical protein
MKLNDLLVGTSKDHSFEPLLSHLIVDQGDVVDLIGCLQLWNAILRSPTSVNVFPLLEGVQVNCLDQLFPLSLQLSKQRDFRFFGASSVLFVFIDLHVKSSTYEPLIID